MQIRKLKHRYHTNKENQNSKKQKTEIAIIKKYIQQHKPTPNRRAKQKHKPN